MKRRNKRRIAAMCMAVAMAVSSGVSTISFAATTSTEESEREIRNAALSMEAATQGMVLLENENETLPLQKSGNIALFGSGAYYTVKGGTGSGDVNQRYTVNVEQGFTNAGYHVTSTDWISAYGEAWEAGYVESGQARNYMLDDLEITQEDIEKAKEGGTDTVVYVVARVSGESMDRKIEGGDYYLSDMEYANIQKCAENFEHCIVVLNVGGVIDTKFYEEIEGIDAMLLMSEGGMRGGDAVVSVLNGEVTPSGKLTATWAKNYEDYPASEYIGENDGDSLEENYQEGIYVGYRYFDTFNVEPAYEFGYGKSYTDFSIEVNEVTADSQNVTVEATVTNTGSEYSGKEVVQVYFSAPDGVTEKPYQELAAFGKTDELAPGESQTLTITFRTTEMSSFDETTASYVMDAGDYYIRVGNSSRNTTVAAVLNLDEQVVTEILSHQMEADEEMEELSKAGQDPYSYESEEAEKETAPVITLSADTFETLNNASEYDDESVNVYVSATTQTEYLRGDQEENEITIGSYSGEEISYTEKIVEFREENGELIDYSGYTLRDVYDGTITMEQYVSGMSLETLSNIVVGSYGSGSSAVGEDYNDGTYVGAQAKSVNGAAGETFDDAEEYIPGAVMADGPAGIRISREYSVVEDGETVNYYQYCTAFPIGTALAQTWDLDVMQEVCTAIGEEMQEYGVSIWLAPGMNLQRDPLCGRNYEYYSEDPYLTGMMGAAAVAGIQSTPGIGVTIKHYMGNNQEASRNEENNTINERTLRELYLKGFEIAVKQGKPMAIMTSYNLNNGVPAADDYDLCTDICRGEWGFDGFIMTDWGGGQSTPIYSMHAGNDIIMPGGNPNVILTGFIDEVEPTFTQNGVPETTLIERTSSYGTVQYEDYEWGEFTPSEEGQDSVSTVVEKGIEINQDRIDKIQETYGNVVEIEENYDGEGNTRITYTGDYVDKSNVQNQISLGDVQKSAIAVLNAIMATDQFASQFDDIEALSYTEAREDSRIFYMELEKSEIK